MALTGIGSAVRKGDLAAAYVAAAMFATLYLLHVIEFKLNKLLDDRGIHVWDIEIAKD